MSIFKFKFASVGLAAALSVVSGFVFAADPLVIYSGRSDKFVQPVVDAFTKQTGIDVIVHSGQSTELLNKLKLEGDSTDADLYISNDAGNLQLGTDRGLFQTLPADLVEQVPANYRAADGSWLGLSARARVLVVNKNADDVNDIQSVFELAKPELAGKIAITTSANESFIAGATVYQRATGDDELSAWLRGARRNAEGEAYAKHSHVVRDVAAGRKSVGLVNHYYIFRHLAAHPDAPIRLQLPDQEEQGMGVAWNVAGVAQTKATDNSAAARQLIAFFISPIGQQQFADVNREYPVIEGIPTAEGLPPRDGMRIADVPMADLAKYRNSTLDLIEAAQLP